MLQTIEAECRYAKGFTGWSSLQPEVMDAMRLGARQDFVPSIFIAMAYNNSPFFLLAMVSPLWLRNCWCWKKIRQGCAVFKMFCLFLLSPLLVNRLTGGKESRLAGLIKNIIGG